MLTSHGACSSHTMHPTGCCVAAWAEATWHGLAHGGAAPVLSLQEGPRTSTKKAEASSRSSMAHSSNGRSVQTAAIARKAGTGICLEGGKSMTTDTSRRTAFGSVLARSSKADRALGSSSLTSPLASWTSEPGIYKVTWNCVLFWV